MSRENKFGLQQSALFMVVLATFAGIALNGIRSAILNIDENRCEMTYMFQWPRYNHIPMFKGTSKLYPRFGLYLYSEGESIVDVSKDTRLTGIPVLFVPGNAGSFKQARSFASVALKKAEDSRYEFNYFTVDLDEGLSGIFGGMLDKQAEFVGLCVSRILRLYKGNKTPPKSVVLIGHSMGGLIARALFTLPKFDPKMVHTIITLGTPHNHPVIHLDPFLGLFYNKVNKLWRKGVNDMSRDSVLGNVTLVSVSGGFRDLLVRSSISSSENWLPLAQGLSAVTTSIPRVWASVDHLCLCWCKQLVLTVNRALFDMIDPVSSQITLNKKTRMTVFRHHFMQNPGTRKIHTVTSDNTVIGLKHLNPVLIQRRLWVSKGTRKNARGIQNLFVFPVDDWKISHDALLILTNHTSESWLFACNGASGHPCATAVDLSHFAQLLPAGGSTLRFAYLKFKDFSTISHFALSSPLTVMPNLLWSEFHSRPASQYSLDVPWLFSRSHNSLDIEADVIFVNITLPSITKIWKVYVLQVESKDCETSSLIIGRINIPWFNENSYSSSHSGSIRMLIKLNHPRPRGFVGNAEVHLWLDPECSHTVSIKPDLYEVLGQIYRFYGIQVLPWTYSMLLLILAWQISSVADMVCCPSFFDLMSNAPRSLRVLLLVIQVHFVVSQVVLPFFVMQGSDGHHDWLPGISDLRTFDWLMPLVLVACTSVFFIIIIFVWSRLLIKLGSKLFFWQQDVQDLLVRKPSLPLKQVAVSLTVFMVSVFLCGTLGLIVAFLFFLGRTCKQVSLLSQQERAGQGATSIRLISLLKGISNFSQTICTLTVFNLVISMPSLVVWAQGLGYSYRLVPDPTAVLGTWMGLNLIHLGYNPLGDAPKSFVYIAFLVAVLVTQAPLFPLFMLPYTSCIILTSLNVTRITKQVSVDNKKIS